jgi:agmatinase
MQFASVIVCAVFLAPVLAHYGRDHDDQIPLDYVKYPYQAVYQDYNEGIISSQHKFA